MSFLAEITAARRLDAQQRSDDGALAAARIAATAAPPARDFAGALCRDGMSLIAEIKRASPSVGAIDLDIDPAAIARRYEAGGAAAISVLTEPAFFRGSLEDLRTVRDVVALPVLRKDFNCEPLHIWEARAAGADAVLLIVAALTQGELVSLGDLAESLGMGVLVEVHDADEISRAREAGARIVGINTRNLATLTVDPAVIAELAPLVPDETILVGESGVKTRADVEMMRAAGCDAVLVGEAVMRAPDPAATIGELLAT